MSSIVKIETCDKNSRLTTKNEIYINTKQIISIRAISDNVFDIIMSNNDIYSVDKDNLVKITKREIS